MTSCNNSGFVIDPNAPHKYIIFDTNVFGLEIEPLSGYPGQLIKEPDPIYRLGYKLKYWSYNNKRYEFKRIPNENITVSAVWEESNNIIFDVGESEDIIVPIFSEPGELIEAPLNIPSIEGKIFTGWSYMSNPYIFNKMPKQSIILNANYIDETKEFNSYSNLPKMFINLEYFVSINSINRENYLNSTITILSNDANDNFIAIPSEFKGRGHGSWDSGPKKGYRIKLFNKEALFGEAKSKHWVLLAGANFYDTTLSKNAMAFNLANNVFDNIEYATSTNFVELYINGDYRGIYILAEHVRVDKERVNIKAEFGVNNTGYLIEYDAYATERGPEGIYYFVVEGYKHPFTIKRPDPDDFDREGITEETFRNQVNYIKEYTTTAMRAALEGNLKTFRQYVDINSVIDMYLLHELFKNTDTGWGSLFMAKKPDGKIYFTAPWDFDATAGMNRGNSTHKSPYGFYVSDTIRTAETDYTESELFISLMQIPEFKTMVASRWHQISNNIKNEVNNFLSDDFITTNKEAFGRNFYYWSGKDSSYGIYQSLEFAVNKWELDVINLRNWLIDRANWFDGAF